MEAFKSLFITPSSLLLSSILLSALANAALPRSADAMQIAGEVDVVPAVLVIRDGGTTPYPDPICLDCPTVVVKRSNASANAVDGSGTLYVTGRSATSPMYAGELGLVVEVDGSARYEMTVLADGHTIQYDLPPGEGWTWDDVTYVWVVLDDPQ